MRNNNDLADFQLASPLQALWASDSAQLCLPSELFFQVSLKLEVCQGVVLDLLRMAHSYTYLTILSLCFVPTAVLGSKQTKMNKT